MSKTKPKVKPTKAWAWQCDGELDLFDLQLKKHGRWTFPVYVLDARDYKAMKAELRRLAEVEVGYVASIHGISRHAARVAIAKARTHSPGAKKR